MLSQPLRNYLQTNVRILTIIWIAMQVAAALYYFIARLMGHNWLPEDRLELPFAPVFYVWAALMAGASILYQRWAFSDARLVKTLSTEVKATALGAAVLSRGAARGILDEPDKRLVGAFTYIQTSYIITWAFQEAVAIMGLLMAILIRDTTNVFLFNIVAIALIFTTRPAPLPLLERAQQLLRRGAGA